MKKIVMVVFVLALMAGTCQMAMAAPTYGLMPMQGDAQANAPMVISLGNAETDFKNEMRRLWSDHVIWTRLFIVSSVAGLPDAGPAADRLLRNQQDIGRAITSYYGNDAGDKLAGLLREHILIAANIVTAAKGGDNDAAADGEKKWLANADAIAAFLSAVNPRWPAKDLQRMLYQHFTLTKDELVARLGGDWAGDIAAFDGIYSQALMMADTLAYGIIKQFPDKFRK